MTSIDFRRQPKVPRLGWVLLIAGALAVVTTYAWSRQVRGGRDEALQAVQVRAERERLMNQPLPVAAPRIRDVRFQQAESELRQPWLATLRAIEALSQAPVYLRSLALDPATQTIKLEGDAPSFDEALTFSRDLDQDPLFKPAMLTSHEQAIDPATGRSLVRFTVESRWNRP